MKHLTPIAIALLLPAALSGCGLVNKVTQPPIRLLQAGARTLTTDAADTTPPATREAGNPHRIAVKATQSP